MLIQMDFKWKMHNWEIRCWVSFYSSARNYLHTWGTVGVGNVIQGMDLVYSQTKSPNPYERQV